MARWDGTEEKKKKEKKAQPPSQPIVDWLRILNIRSTFLFCEGGTALKRILPSKYAFNSIFMYRTRGFLQIVLFPLFLLFLPLTFPRLWTFAGAKANRVETSVLLNFITITGEEEEKPNKKKDSSRRKSSFQFSSRELWQERICGYTTPSIVRRRRRVRPRQLCVPRGNNFLFQLLWMNSGIERRQANHRHHHQFRHQWCPVNGNGQRSENFSLSFSLSAWDGERVWVLVRSSQFKELGTENSRKWSSSRTSQVSF